MRNGNTTPWVMAVLIATMVGAISNTHAITIDVSINPGSAVPGCEIDGSCLTPANAMIRLGDTVRWVNNDSAAHTVTSGSTFMGPSGIFDSGLMLSGQSFIHTFNSIDVIPYFDQVHPWVVGQVTAMPAPPTNNGVPEPITAALILMGLGALGMVTRRRVA